MPDFGKLLIFDENKRLIQEFDLSKAEITIGREPGNDLIISQVQVSRRHARLYRQAGQWLIENLSQANPVMLNGYPLTGPTPLFNGGQFQLGLFTAQLMPGGSATQLLGGSAKPVAVAPPNSAPAFVAPPSASSGPVPALAPDPSGPVQQEKKTVFMSDEFEALLIVEYLDKKEEYQLTKLRHTLGRDPDNDIAIPISTISRLHAVLNRTPNGYSIVDQNSTNGLLYKGNRVQEQTLDDGDVVRISDDLGNWVTLTYDDLSNSRFISTRILQIDPAQAVITIGRAVGNTIVLNYPQVSSQHAVIRRGTGEAFVEDLGSTNGTYVQGQRVKPNAPVAISPGQTIQIAGYQLVYQEDGIAQAKEEKVRIDVVNLRQTVNNNTLILLNDISLSIQPKEFVALVGGSGTGKSTLMNAINGFRPAADGKVYMNGQDYYQNFGAYRRTLGYVPQDDIIHRELTVERALYYVARLRLPNDTSDEEIEKRVAEVLEDVEMTDRRTVEVSRLSGGQRKRVSIAVELISKPNLFFLDEPTSGLDPGLDKRMMYLLRRLADQGRTIILVTHATSNITACDKVVFLAKGGKLCFFGTPAEVLKFFEVTEFADIYSKLDQTATSGEEWEKKYRASPYYQKYITEPLSHLPPAVPAKPEFGAADAASVTSATTVPATQSQVKAPRNSGWRQFTILSRRYAELLRRDRINLLVLLLQAPIIAIILAIVIKDGVFEDSKPPVDAQKVLFMLAVAAVWLGTNNSAREITKENPVYQRERLVNLRVFAYIMSKVVVLAVLCLVQSILLTGIVLAKAGFPTGGGLLPAPLEMLIGVWLTTLGGLAMGLLISSLASNTDKATSIVPIILVPQIILAGLIFPLTGPGQVLSYATVTRWSIDSLGTSADVNRLYYKAISNIPFGASTENVPGVSLYDPKDYDDEPGAKTPEDARKTHITHLLGRWGILLGMIVLLLALTWFFQKRKDLNRRL